MCCRVVFEMLFDRPVPADLAWGVIGEWSPKTDYTKLAKGIYAKLGDHNLLRSVVFFKGDEEVGRWGHSEEIEARYCETV
jgi:hypothetical protein